MKDSQELMQLVDRYGKETSRAHARRIWLRILAVKTRMLIEQEMKGATQGEKR